MIFRKRRERRKLNEDPNVLFDGDDKLFKKLLTTTAVYGEYGCGKSTKWTLENTSTHIISVDTNKKWVQAVKKENADHKERLTIECADLGKTGKWGRPLDYSKRDSFSTYTNFLWEQTQKPSVVLVDGRFRVCCFLTSLKFADEGTTIVFDDYTDRPHYHFVEQYVPRADTCGRQCLFLVPAKDNIDFESLERDISAFRHVMD